MSLWILDTDHVSLLLERHPQVSRKISEVGADVAITVVTVQELFNGWVVRICEGHARFGATIWQAKPHDLAV
jgi:tRNA(fMet)-specific endonuclease VapC